MLEHFLHDEEEIPAVLLVKYFDFCVRRLAIYMTQHKRQVRMSMEAEPNEARHEEICRKIIGFLAEDGLSSVLPPHRISELSTPGDLEDAMWIHVRECRRATKSLKSPSLRLDRIPSSAR